MPQLNPWMEEHFVNELDHLCPVLKFCDCSGALIRVWPEFGAVTASEFRVSMLIVKRTQCLCIVHAVVWMRHSVLRTYPDWLLHLGRRDFYDHASHCDHILPCANVRENLPHPIWMSSWIQEPYLSKFPGYTQHTRLQIHRKNKPFTKPQGHISKLKSYMRRRQTSISTNA